MFPPAVEMHCFQEKLQCCGKLADIGPILEYDASAYALSVTNLKPSVKEALTRPNQIHWWEAIKAEMDGLESMHIWETVDKPNDTNLVDSKLVLQVKTNANNVPYKFKAVRGLAPETQRWLGTIDINVGLLPSVLSISGPLVCYEPPSDVTSPATLLLLSLQRVPSSSSTVQGVPLAPLLSSSSYVSSFDTAPPPQDLLAGLLYTAPPPSTAKSLASPRPHLDHGRPWSTLLWIGLIPDTYAPTIRTNSLLTTCAFKPMTKARFCAHGFSQKEGIDFDEIFAPVVPRDTIRTILTIAARSDWEIDSIDVTQAYLNTNLHHDIYLKLPEGAEVLDGKVYKLIKSLYGLKQSGREWHKELDAHLRRLGFFPLPNVPCVYLKGAGESQVIIAIYVDNMLIVSPQRDQIDQTKRAIINKWKITNNRPTKEFLKIKITQDWEKRVIDLDQRAYIKEIIQEWIQPHERTWTPMTHTPSKPPTDLEADQELKARYPVLVGKLLWVSNTVRPDISFAINTLALHMSKPTKEAMQVALRIVKYLNQTQDEVLRLGGRNKDEPAIVAYTNSNWASDPNTDRRSTSDSIIKIFGSVVTWNSHVQKCVSDSAVKAEYIAGSAATCKALFHWHLLRGLGFGDHIQVILMDNTGCVQVAKDQALHSRLKHIDTKYHLICNHIMEGDVAMRYVQTEHNDADYLTKPVSQHLLKCTRQQLGMVSLRLSDHSVCKGDSEIT
ncbi:uncharacterized protein UHOD_11257 [Ustilago sp. UG-2017b]|nr:uncharacterized protein UHOD_11257 [Ustilago sp. UG-2017b]